jgi:hypothetical protein
MIYQKKFTPKVTINSEILHPALAILYDVTENAQLELFAPLAIRFLIANYCTRRGCNFKGLLQAGGRAKFAENLRASPFNEDL